MTRMNYSLWKQYYRKFPADQYDLQSKTILVDLPDVEPVKFPKEWRLDGNHYFTPGGCVVTFWNTGLARNYVVEKFDPAYPLPLSKTICPGVNSAQRVIDTVKLFEGVA